MLNVFWKTLQDKRAFLLSWSVGLGLIGFLMIIFYPAFHQNDALAQLVNNLPPALKGIVGDLNNLKELSSYIGSQLFEIRIPILVSVFAIILSISLSVAEEEKGQLRTLVALPVSRTSTVLAKWGAVLVVCAVVTLGTLAGVRLGLISINDHLGWQVFLRLGIMMWLVAVCLATIVLSVGLATGRRGITMVIGVVVAVGSFILTTFSASVDWLRSYEKLSVLHYFQAVTVAKSHIELRDIFVFLAITAFFLLMGIFFFRRRDIQ